MKIIPLSEGSFTIDKSKQFVPFDEKEHALQERPVGSLLVEIQPFLVITSRDIILLDTGLGFNDADGKLQLHKNLMAHHINPSEVSKVFLSHLHKDHAGGAGHNAALNFPQAAYYVPTMRIRGGLDGIFWLVAVIFPVQIQQDWLGRNKPSLWRQPDIDPQLPVPGLGCEHSNIVRPL